MRAEKCRDQVDPTFVPQALDDAEHLEFVFQAETVTALDLYCGATVLEHLPEPRARQLDQFVL